MKVESARWQVGRAREVIEELESRKGRNGKLKAGGLKMHSFEEYSNKCKWMQCKRSIHLHPLAFICTIYCGIVLEQ